VRAVDGISFALAERHAVSACSDRTVPARRRRWRFSRASPRPTPAWCVFRGEPRDAGYRDVIGIQFQHTALQDFQTVHEALRPVRQLL
jgi:ABC-2 type transport system ATP-binding protein